MGVCNLILSFKRQKSFFQLELYISYISGQTFSVHKAAFLQLTSPSAMLWGTEPDSQFTIKSDRQCASLPCLINEEVKDCAN